MSDQRQWIKWVYSLRFPPRSWLQISGTPATFLFFFFFCFQVWNYPFSPLDGNANRTCSFTNSKADDTIELSFIVIFIKMVFYCEFSGSPVIRTWHLHCQGLCLISGQVTKILQTMKLTKNKHKKVFYPYNLVIFSCAL